MEKVDIAHQRGKRRHITAAWKEKIWRSSVKKEDMVQHGGKSSVEKVDMVQLCGKSRHSASAWKK